MLAEVPPPAIPGVVYGLLALSSLLAWAVSKGLLDGWDRTFGSLFEAIGHKSIPVGLGKSIRPFGFLLTANQKVRAGLGWAVHRSEKYMVYFWGKVTSSVLALAHFIANLPDVIAAALQGLGTTVIVKAKALTAAQWAQIKRIPALIRRLDHLHAYIEARVRHAIAVAVGAGAAALDDAIGAAGHLGELAWKRTGRLSKRLTKVEKLLVGAGLATLGLRLLSRLRLGWLRCSNVSRVGRRVCGLNPGLLESLLADTLLIVGTISLVEFAEEVQGVTDFAAGAIRKFVRVV